MSKEVFQPVSNTKGSSLIGNIKFYGRMLLDFQILTIYRAVKKKLPTFNGKVLDIGCGQSPYKFLLNESQTQYYGVDIVDAEKFDYHNKDITPFNGEDIPFENDFFDHIICTEVLEHVEKYQKLVDEMHRVLRTGGKGIITIPFSARYHYIPYDYFRYTPSSLKTIFEKFKTVTITNRGTDVAVIGNKLIVLFFRNLFPANKLLLLFIPIWICLLPFLALMVLIAQISLLLNLGSEHDPLGYTITLEK